MMAICEKERRDNYVCVSSFVIHSVGRNDF
jgi:hypothetical protein